MDFKAVTRALVSEFSASGIAYGLIGGYAVGLWGVARSTVDMDFLVRRDEMPKVHDVMERLGYGVWFSSENVSQYRAGSRTFGEVDFLHAFRTASLGMLGRAVEKTLFGDGIKLKVLLPEDLIGLKMQAIANDPSRGSVDMFDVESLMELHGRVMDWELIRTYFEIFESMPLFAELEKKYHAPH